MKKRIVRIATASVAVMLLAISCDKGDGYQYQKTPTPEPVPDGWVWSELPEGYDTPGENQVKITHEQVFGGKWGRSYTMMYDTKEKVSYWVAYPLHTVYIGNISRIDNWAKDPEVAESLQVPIWNGGYGARAPDGVNYDRGHQLPFADRRVTRVVSDQTFYATNMTPQHGTLNQGEWALLEGWVRSKATQSGRYDTLYVVTGCKLPDVMTDDDYVSKNGVKGAIPEAYYKVLLRTRTGYPRVPNENDCECIGFWIENKAPANGYKNWVKSVSDIEKLTGFKFFPSASEYAKSNVNTSQWAL